MNSETSCYQGSNNGPIHFPALLCATQRSPPPPPQKKKKTKTKKTRKNKKTGVRLFLGRRSFGPLWGAFCFFEGGVLFWGEDAGSFSGGDLFHAGEATARRAAKRRGWWRAGSARPAAWAAASASATSAAAVARCRCQSKPVRVSEGYLVAPSHPVP